MANVSYRGYAEWKSWDENASPFKLQHNDMFKIECFRARIPTNARIMEIGFGTGEFLEWCRSAGYYASGVEIIPEQVDAARAKGHEVVLTMDGSPPQLPDDQLFDAIFAFDVFEHLTRADLITWLTWMAKHLRRDGRIVARFPNGGSPFGRLNQAGDLTHLTTLSGASIEQAAMQSGLRMLGVYNAARNMAGMKLAKWLKYKARDVIEVFLGYLYFSERVPLDSNLTVILAVLEPHHR